MYSNFMLTIHSNQLSSARYSVAHLCSLNFFPTNSTQKVGFTYNSTMHFRLLKMEEVVGSAVVHETVNKIIYICVCERKTSIEDHLERLEMAQIKLEITLATANKWQITGDPLFCFGGRSCSELLKSDNKICKRRQHVEEEEAEQLVWNSSFPWQIVHATKSLVLSIYNGNIDEPRRFEWYADGANGFLRSVKFGETPCHYLFFDPLVGHVLAGETLEYKLVQGNSGCYLERRSSISDMDN
uniref:Uncharacterized protein n=1 Tax=Oryza punctata TaxID=4537 RepID=A0A0E0LHM5_ORYPU